MIGKTISHYKTYISTIHEINETDDARLFVLLKKMELAQTGCTHGMEAMNVPLT